MNDPFPRQSHEVNEVLKNHLQGITQYEPIREVAQGGMGTIVQCRDRALNRPVALKRMRPELAGQKPAREQFLQEARITAQLEHPHIIPVHELAKDDQGNLFLVLKWVEGRTLSKFLDGARMAEKSQSGERSRGESRSQPIQSFLALLQLFLKICDAVAFAHSRGIVHADIKPDNVLVGDFGEVLIVDWGLARRMGGESQGHLNADPKSTAIGDPAGSPQAGSRSGEPWLRSASTLETVWDIHNRDTVAGDFLDARVEAGLEGPVAGTPAYMSPEQATGRDKEINERSDVYALGAILYELLAFEPAVSGSTLPEMLAQIRTGRVVPPDQQSPWREIPRALSAVCMKALERDPKDRYSSAGEMGQDVRRFLEGRHVLAYREGWLETAARVARPHRIAVIVALAALLAIGVTIAGVFTRIQDALAQALESERIANEMGLEARQAEQAQLDAALLASQERAEMAVDAAGKGLIFEAEILASGSERLAPDGPWGAYARGVLARERKELAEARACFQRALRADPSHFPSSQELARLDHAESMARAAEATFQNRASPDSWRTLLQAGDTLASLGDHGKAREAYQAALEQMNKAQDVQGEIFESAQRKLDNSKAWSLCQGFDKTIQALPPDQQMVQMQKKMNELHGEHISFYPTVDQGVIRKLGMTVNPRLKYLHPFHGLSLTELDCWATKVSDLGPLKGMPLKNLNIRQTQVDDLTPLRGMPLTELMCDRTAVADLSPLKGMPLQSLDCSMTRVRDLKPLRGMPMTSLVCWQTSVADLSPLRGVPLESLNCWKTEVADLGPLRGMPLRSLNCSETQVNSLSGLEGMPLNTLEFFSTQVSNLYPLRNLPLHTLNCMDTQVSDLSPLEGLPLTTLNCGGTQIQDFRPLQGLPLTFLACGQTGITDLTVLKGLPLKRLHLPWTTVSDLSPLRGMPLTLLECSATQVTDLSPLRGMALRCLSLAWTPVSDLTPLEGMPFEILDLSHTQVTDLTPLSSLKGKLVQFFPPPKESLTPASLQVIDKLGREGTWVRW